jgi:uncharacterized protein YdeI (YjbR/CyaY-like superfamily)
LIRQKQMTEAGLKLVRAAKKSGQWQKATVRDKTMSIPDDLDAALSQNKKAQQHFERFAPSHRNIYIAWILDAKRPETRARRIKAVVERSVADKRPGV